jgi:hypothetical protein
VPQERRKGTLMYVTRVSTNCRKTAKEKKNADDPTKKTT